MAANVSDKTLDRALKVKELIWFGVGLIVLATASWTNMTWRVANLETAVSNAARARDTEDARLGRIERNIARIGEKIGATLENPN